MLVLYVTFELEGVGGDSDRAFRRWLADIATTTQEVEGCVSYDYVVDLEARRGNLVEVWTSTVARDGYVLMPHHVEMVALATSKWGMHGFRTMCWPDAGEAAVSARERSEEPSASRQEMNRLVAAYVSATGDDRGVG